MLVVLLVFNRKLFANVVKHLPRYLMTSQEIVKGALAALAAKGSLLLEVEVTRQVHSNLISNIASFQVQE